MSRGALTTSASQSTSPCYPLIAAHNHPGQLYQLPNNDLNDSPTFLQTYSYFTSECTYTPTKFRIERTIVFVSNVYLEVSRDNRAMAIARRPPAKCQNTCCQHIHDGLDPQDVGNHAGKEQDGNRASVIQHRLEGKHAPSLLLGCLLLHYRLRGNVHHV